ncbi:MAG: MlaD family protein [Deltaproteobacteria bacterium]|nr:MlaD family protein [Deltaproteobacteria bacterium]
MVFKLTPQLKVGFFVLAILSILAYATIRVSQKSLLPGSTYNVYLLIDTANGITKKTPVQIAGIQIGSVSDVELQKNNQAKIELEIDRGVKLSGDVEARIKTLGFLGDTYIELYQPGPIEGELKPKSTITNVASYGDFSTVTGQMGAIAEDVKAVTATLKILMAGDDSPFARTVMSIERITDSLDRVTAGNEQNLNAIVANLKAMAENLNLVVARNAANVDTTMENAAEITEKIRRGEGTIGRLVNDDTTVDKLNDSIDNLNDLLGTTSKMQVGLGYRAEYLGVTEQFKNYVSLSLKPRPDKYFLFEFVDDPAPDSKFVTKETTITSGGTTSTVTEEVETVEADRFLFSAMLAKQYYDFTFKGGLIESSGGAGVDYNKGPFGIQFTAFDFETKQGERPHLKAMGTANVTKSIYMAGGVDDFISNQQDTDWFLGAGVRITDDDLKSIFGMLNLKP